MTDAKRKAIMAKNETFEKLASEREAKAKARQAKNQEVKEGLIW